MKNETGVPHPGPQLAGSVSVKKKEKHFSGISQNFNDFGKSDVKILIFQRNLRNFAEILQNSDAKLLEICPKKMDPLNPHGGNTIRKHADPTQLA